MMLGHSYAEGLPYLQELAYSIGRERERLTGVVIRRTTEESPPINWVRSHIHLWMARVIAMAQKRYVFLGAMKSSERRTGKNDGTVNLYGCKSEQKDICNPMHLRV